MYDDDSAMLSELARNPHAAEILDLVSESGCNAALLARFVSRADLTSALRLMADHGLIASTKSGVHDPLTVRGTIRLTERGEAIARAVTNSRATRTTREARRSPIRHRLPVPVESRLKILDLFRHQRPTEGLAALDHAAPTKSA